MRRNDVAPHNQELLMMSAIVRFFDSLFAPLAREVDRMPPSALRHLMVAGL